MFKDEEFRDGASLLKYINKVDKNYLRDRAGDIKKNQAGDAVEKDIKRFVQCLNVENKKTKHGPTSKAAPPGLPLRPQRT